MLYIELAFVSIITRLFSPNHAQNGVSYTIAGSTATCISGVDTCTISDVKGIDVINCNDANQCIINCDEKKGLESAQIFAQNSPNFTLTVSGDQCMKNAVVDVSTASNARIAIQPAVKYGLQTAKVDARNAQFLLIDVMSGSSFGWPQVYCPSNSAYSGPKYDAPCVMNNSEGGGSDVGIYVSGGYPKDFQYLPTPVVDSAALTFSSLQVYMGCGSGDADESNEGLLNWLSWDSYSTLQSIIEDGSSNVCYATKTPTKDPTRATTFQPTKTPTKVPTKTPTRSPTQSPTSPTKRPTKSPVPPLTAKPATTSTTATATRATTSSLSTMNPNANEHRVDDQSATTADAAHHSQTNDTTLASQSHWKLIAITLSCVFCCIFSFMLCGCYWLFSKRKSMAKFQRDEPQADFNYFAMPGAGSGADSAIANVSGLRYVQLADVSSSLQFTGPVSVPLQASVNALPSSQSAHLRTGEVSFELLNGAVVPGAFETTVNVKMGELDVDMDEEDESVFDSSVAKQESVTAGGDGGGGGAASVLIDYGKLTVVDRIRLSTVTTVTQADEDDIPPQTPIDNAFGGQIGDEDFLQIENASDDNDDDDASENDMETMG